MQKSGLPLLGIRKGTFWIADSYRYAIHDVYVACTQRILNATRRSNPDSGLWNHNAAKHAGKVFQCFHCDGCFNTKQRLKDHAAVAWGKKAQMLQLRQDFQKLGCCHAPCKQNAKREQKEVSHSLGNKATLRSQKVNGLHTLERRQHVIGENHCDEPLFSVNSYDLDDSNPNLKHPPPKAISGFSL